MSGCLLCRKPLEPFLDLGRMPLANGFLYEKDFAEERFFALKAGFCPSCALVQLTERVAPERMFHDAYPFFTASSLKMAEHFRAWAVDIKEGLPERDPFVVEIGSNDGTLLAPLAAAGVRHLGVEPSANVAEAAPQERRRLVRFFAPDTARAIRRDHGQADAVVAANCFCHIADLQGLAEGVALLLAGGRPRLRGPLPRRYRGEYRLRPDLR